MKIFIPIIITVFGLVGFVMFMLMNNNDTAGTTFTMEEVRAANSLDTKCLAVYKEDVYEIPSSWGRQHPGGSHYIASICGTDMSVAFGDQHENSARAISQLSEFKVGTLEK